MTRNPSAVDKLIEQYSNRLISSKSGNKADCHMIAGVSKVKTVKKIIGTANGQGTSGARLVLG